MKLTIYGNQPIIAPRDPVLPLEAATKQYVDNGLSNHASDTNLHLTTTQRNFLNNITAGYEQINYLAGLTSNVQDQLNSKLNKAGDTMTGTLTLSGNPVDNLHAATKNYVDTADDLKLDKTGGAVTGYITLHAAPTSNLHAATKQYVDSELSTHTSDDSIHLTAAQNTLIDGITATSTEINYSVGVTSGIQGQIDSKLDLAGGNMSGSLTLNADPTASLHASTKQYVDSKAGERVAKSGDTMTGALTLSGAPTNNLHAATKQYVDTEITTHSSDDSIHLTAAQNTLIDGITVSAAQINNLANVSSDIQTQLDAKFDKSGGTITGDVTLSAGKTVFVNKIPTADTELVNKNYVDSLLEGKSWEDPVVDINLIRDTLSTPPVTPINKDLYIVGPSATGAWVGLEGYAVYYNTGTTSWVTLLNRAVAVGDRFGIAFDSATVPGGSFTGLKNNIITITDATPGAIQFDTDVIGKGSTTIVTDPESGYFGQTFTRKEDASWIVTNTSTNISTGSGLTLTGNIVSIKQGPGVSFDVGNNLTLDIESPLYYNGGSGKLTVDVDDTTIKIDGTTGKLKLDNTYVNYINDRISKTGTSAVDGGQVTFQSNSSLKIEYTITDIAHAVNKNYVDTLINALDVDITALQTAVGNLVTDPVTKTYVDTNDALKVNKSGDTMTGQLTLVGSPSSLHHAADKEYVDGVVSTHTSDATKHLTAAQNTLIDGITATSTEINYTVGVSSGIQTQLDNKLGLDGGTLTGAITLHADPTGALHAATKQYVDTTDALKVNKSGDTMTGALTLSGAPTNNLHAATKQYVDSELTSHSSNTSLHITTGQRSLLDNITATATEINYIVGVTSGIQTQLDNKLNLSGGTLSGFVTLHANPTTAMQASPKQYVDSKADERVAKSGDTMTGALTLSGAPTVDLHAATKKYVDDRETSILSYVDTQDNTRLSKSGGTMTGALTLSGAPTVDLHAATKLYVDSVDAARKTYVDTQDSGLQGQINSLQSTVGSLNADPVTKTYVDSNVGLKVNKAGDTLTGYLTLHADPQQSMHPTTKQYVDSIAQGLKTKPSIRLATTANLAATYNNGTLGVNATLTGSSNGALAVDGKTPVVGDRILVRLQTNKLENGDYVVQQVGNGSSPFILKRVVTNDESTEIPGSYFYIYDGNTLKGTGWTFSVDDPVTFTIGTNDINVNQFSGQGSLIGGNGLTLDGNTFNINTANSGRIVVNADNIDLATTGITPNTYTKVTVDGYGRVTSASNPNTLAGYGITDGQTLNANLTSLSNVSTAGIVVRDSTNAIVTKSVAVNGVGLSISNAGGATAGNISISINSTSDNTADTVVSRDSSGNFAANVITANLNGNANSATTLANSRNFSLTGDATASAVAFNGSDNVQLSVVLSNVLGDPGTFTKVTADTKGRIVAGENPTTLSGYGITDAVALSTFNTKVAELEAKFNELYLYVLSRI